MVRTSEHVTRRWWIWDWQKKRKDLENIEKERIGERREKTSVRYVGSINVNHLLT